MSTRAMALAFLAAVAGLLDFFGNHPGLAAEPANQAESDPYDAKAVAADKDVQRPIPIYTKQNAPPTPALDALPLQASVSQYGVTWTFERPARVGRFLNGDWYVVGPGDGQGDRPPPLYGSQIPRRELDHMDQERREDQRVRNGFMLNPPAQMKVAYDSGVRNYFDPSLVQRLPVAMRPGDSLVSTISMPKGLVLHAPLRNKIERGVEDSSPIRTAAVLTCVASRSRPTPCVPPSATAGRRSTSPAISAASCSRPRPGPKARPRSSSTSASPSGPGSAPASSASRSRWRTCRSTGWNTAASSGMAALLLCTDLPPAEKEHLLVNYVQIGIDLGGMVRAGHPGWTGWGGHGSGRKLPIVLAGLILGDDQLANVNRSFPKVSFGEDEQTAYGDCWTGAKVVFAGHSGIDAATGVGRNRGRGNPWGPYEHTAAVAVGRGAEHQRVYRRCCTSVGWVAQALALRLLHAEPAWAHDPFFDYVDRWMYENDAAFVKTIKQATGRDHDKDWSRQGQAWDAFTDEMWAKHRPTLPAPTDGWRQPHDDSYYRAAIEKSR